MVFADHVCGRLSTYLPVANYSPIAPLIVPIGFPWVWLFLMLSGFLLTKGFAVGRFNLDKMGIMRFSIARMYRLLPLLWFVGMLWLLLATLGLWGKVLPRPEIWREVGIAFALPWLPYFQSTNAISSMNSPVWSAVVEVHFSLLLPWLFVLIGLSARRLSILVLLWGAGIAILGISVMLSGNPVVFPLIYGSHFYNLGFFLVGGVLALSPRFSAIKRMPWLVVLLVAASALLLLQYAAYYNLNATLALSPLLMLPIWAMVVARCDDSYQAKIPSDWGGLWRRKRAPLAVLEIIGMMSYSLYLAHKPISYLLIEWLDLGAYVSGYLGFFAVTFICLLLSLPVYCALFIYIERRFRFATSSTNSLYA